MIEGGCFCGSIRYQIEGALQHARACHCSRCRKAFSGASSAYAEVAAGSTFRWIAGEDKLTRHMSGHGWGLAFCSACGSTLCGMFGDQVHGVTLGCIDGDPGVKIEMHIFVGSKAPWDHIAGDAPQFEERPPNPSIPAE
ncbi:GFA family protein [Sorangium sp. So ce1182]|uniref:GFA family protein n=1 Tax=Sorangium sp. So ce1182 TaxID=3133334 RepID=UPI003F60FF03